MARLVRDSKNFKMMALSQASTDAPETKRLDRILSRSRAINRTLCQGIIENSAKGYQAAGRAQAKAINHSTMLLNSILATDVSKSLESWLKAAAETTPTIYDKAADAVYNASHIGGGQLHRLLDGSHTPWGMWDKTHNALADDSFHQETSGYFAALWHDFTTRVGIPIATWNQSNYNQVAGYLNETFGIPRSWFQDVLHINAIEFLGSSIGVIGVAYQRNKKDVKQFSLLCESLGVSATMSANPALGVVALAGLGKSFMDSKTKNEDVGFEDLLEGLSKGGIGTGLVLETSSVLGGPSLMGLIAGICVGTAAHKAMNIVQLKSIAEFMLPSFGECPINAFEQGS